MLTEHLVQELEARFGAALNDVLDKGVEVELPELLATLAADLSRQADALETASAPGAEAESLGPRKSNVDDDGTKGTWTIQGWLSSLDIAPVIAQALTPPSSAPPLDFLRDEAACTRQWLSRSLRAAGLGGLTHTVWAAVEQLRIESTPTELQDKFLQEGVGLLSYSGLSTFFGGLEAKIGSPQPNVHAAMEAEHTQREDSDDKMTTENYGITTTSAIEWRFVGEPDSPPHGGWPVEERLRAAFAIPAASAAEADRPAHGRWGRLNLGLRNLAASGAQHRTALPLSELEAACAVPNAKLSAMGEPVATLEEAIGARLYTGPLFIKYNAVLRGIETDVPFLRSVLIQRCCSASVAAAYEQGSVAWEIVRTKHLNTYTTTLHAINSAIVKLSKVTIATKVYRGVSGRLLPEQFWQPNEFGVQGGIDGAFMSTTTDRAVAMSYASGDRGGFVFEIQQGMIDRGAEISFLSQYPHEQEILFAPLTGLEVLSTRVMGAVMIVSVKLSVNLTSLTMEQVIGKRKKMLSDMVPGLVRDLRVRLQDESLATLQGIDFLTERLPLRLTAEHGLLAHDAQWYNVDQQLTDGLIGVGLEARQMGPPNGAVRVDELRQLDAATREACGFHGPPEAYTVEVVDALNALERSKLAQARVEALGTLDALPPLALAQHIPAVHAALADPEEQVRAAAAAILDRAGPSVFTRKSGAAANSGVLVFPATSSCPGEAPFVTLADSSSGALLVDYMERKWGFAPPDLLLSVTGAAKDFQLDAQLERALEDGLRASLSAKRVLTITGGTDCGVMKLVGTMFARAGVDAPLVGIATFGCVNDRQAFDGCVDAEQRFEYAQQTRITKDGVNLEPHHTHFVFVDSGKVAPKAWGGEVGLRDRMEESMNLAWRQPARVVLVVSGGPHTLTTVLGACRAGQRVVVLKGSGGTADFLAEYVLHEVVAIPEWAAVLSEKDLQSDLHEKAQEIKRLNDKSHGALIRFYGVGDDSAKMLLPSQ